MLGTGWTEVVALVAAYGIAALATPAGISGAVLLLPFQVSVLGTPSPSVTPTNLLYNVVATPGALYRYWRQGCAQRPADARQPGLTKCSPGGHLIGTGRSIPLPLPAPMMTRADKRSP